MEEFWAVLFITALLTFCLKNSYNRGYKAGARRVLEEWKEYIRGVEDDRYE